MDPLQASALVVHLVGIILWIGGLGACGAIVVARAEGDEGGRLSGLAKRAGRVADAGATLAIAGGVWLLSFAAATYMKQPWMHMKLTLVVGLLALHGITRAKSARAERRLASAVPLAVVIVAACIVAVAVFKPLAH